MKRFVLLVLILVIFLIAACSNDIVRSGGIVIHKNANDLSNYMDNYAQEDIVYTTKSGKKYHNKDCSYLSDSKIPMSREQAIAEGKTPCSKCHPDY